MMDIDRRLKKMLRKKMLRPEFARITIAVTDHGIVARAVPNHFHPLVRERRDKAIAERGGEITLTEATEINVAAMREVG